MAPKCAMPEALPWRRYNTCRSLSRLEGKEGKEGDEGAERAANAENWVLFVDVRVESGA
jgi:hypothetical protein